MAKIINQLRKTLLEKQINKLTYQIHVAQAEKDIYKNQLEHLFDKKVKKYSKPYLVELRTLEINQLSQTDYIKYMSQEKLDKLDASYVLKKKALKQSANRKSLASIDKEKLSQLDLWFQAKKAEILKPLEARQIDSETLKQNKQQLVKAEQSFQQALSAFKKTLKEEHQNLLKEKHQKLDQSIDVNSKKLNAKKETLMDILNTLKTNNAQVDISDDALLKVEGLTMQFGGLKAVDNLSFEVKKGEIFGLIGPNGAGKTTVFNCITQFYKPTSGVVTFRNSSGELVSLTDYKVHDVIKQGIVRTFQNVELIWEISILDNMLVGAHSLYRSSFLDHSLQLPRYKREEKILKRRALKILEDLDLVAYKDFYPVGLPYGVLKKIELARTLMTNPKLIILDEPAAGLNDSETEQLAVTIQKIQKDYDCTIFLVEHDMGLVMNICNTICAISFGKKLAIGSPSEVQQNDFVKEAYLGGE